MTGTDPETRAAREVMERAIRRLGILEGLFLGLAAGAALLAGALTGWLLRDLAGLAFRPTWWVSSLLYFVVPGAIVWAKTRRERSGGGRSSAPADRADPEGGPDG